MYKEVQIVNVKLVREKSISYSADKITTPSQAVELAKNFLQDCDREHCIAMFLDVRLKITAIHTIGIGTLESLLLHPREVFKAAILSNASGMIIAHNHPSGDPEPSKNDINITKRLVEAGQILGINIIDHIIVGDESYTSFREEGLIKPLPALSEANG